MDELITVKDGFAILDHTVATQIADFERVIAQLKEKEDELRERILCEMERKGIKKIDTMDLVLTYKAPYDRETFQSKQFREDNPDLYDSYIRMTPVKASVSIKLKEDKE